MRLGERFFAEQCGAMHQTMIHIGTIKQMRCQINLMPINVVLFGNDQQSRPHA